MFRIALAFVALAFSQTPEDLSRAGASSFAQGRYGQAEHEWRQALATAEGIHTSSVPRIQVLLAKALLPQGKFLEAERLLQLALEGMNGSASNERGKARALHALATLYSAVGRQREAEITAERALEAFDSTAGRSDPETAMVLMLLGMLMENKGDLSAADRYFLQALTILEPTQSSELPGVWYNLGHLRYSQKKLDEAEHYFRRTIASERPEHPLVALALENLALVKLKRGFPAEALALNSEAMALAQKALPPGNPSYISMRFNHAKILRALGRKQEARELEASTKEAARNTSVDPRLRNRIDVRTLTR